MTSKPAETQYRNTTLDALLSENKMNDPVEIQAYVRAPTVISNDKIYMYLQSGDKLLFAHAHSLMPGPGMPEPDLCFLKTCAESGLLATLKGTYSTKSVPDHPAELKLAEVSCANYTRIFQ